MFTVSMVKKNCHTNVDTHKQDDGLIVVVQHVDVVLKRVEFKNVTHTHTYTITLVVIPGCVL